MIRKIPIGQLLPGMYIVDLHMNWWEHMLWRRQFLVENAEDVRKVRTAGVREVSIDTSLGIDVPKPLPKLTELEKKYTSLRDQIEAKPRVVSLGEERRRAARLLKEADGLVLDLMNAARGGRVVEAHRLEPVIGKMVESVARNPDALIPLARLKQMGNYATEHAVSTSALIIALARQEGKSDPEVEKLALGALVKDIGLASLDHRLTAKAGAYTPSEQSAMQNHVEEGLAVLEATSNLPDLSVAVVLEHHERFDGLGYPYRMAGEEISLAGRMAAIVDTYDAMTSDRPYRRALSPSAALRQMYESAGSQFDPALVAAFVRTVGVYPVGTLVRLESGHLGVVESTHAEDLLHPVVRVFYHAGRRQYVAPVVVDLSRKFGNHYGKIVQAEAFERWGLNPLSYQPA